MRRRDFIALLSGTAAWPIAAEAQKLSRKIPRIGWLVLIWTASVASLAILSLAFRMLMNLAGLTG